MATALQDAPKPLDAVSDCALPSMTRTGSRAPHTIVNTVDAMCRRMVRIAARDILGTCCGDTPRSVP